MSNTFTHKIEGKFKNGLIDILDVPLSVLKKWDRLNFDAGYYRNERNKKRYNERL